jgi:hypothetical protein
MWHWPLTADEYKSLIDCKYQTNRTGWALTDNNGTVKAWHWLIPGDPKWGTSDGAWRAFIPDTKQRQWRIRYGWTVVLDDGELLNTFLSQAKPDDIGGDDVLY